MIQPMPAYVDAHCHVDLYPDMEDVMSVCDSIHVATVAVTTTPRAWPRNRDLARKFKWIQPALGMHPQLVGTIPSEVALWDSYLSEARIIGEVGLDGGPSYYKTLEAQKEVFSHILWACAKSGGKLLTVHSVRAVKPVLDMVEEHLVGSGCIVILHWFTGTASEAKRAVDLGCYFSVNAEMLRKDIHMKMVQSLPMERLLTETDGPFTRNGQFPRHPSDVTHVASDLARVMGVGIEPMQQALVSNYVRLAEG